MICVLLWRVGGGGGVSNCSLRCFNRFVVGVASFVIIIWRKQIGEGGGGVDKAATAALTLSTSAIELLNTTGTGLNPR